MGVGGGGERRAGRGGAEGCGNICTSVYSWGRAKREHIPLETKWLRVERKGGDENHRAGRLLAPDTNFMTSTVDWAVNKSVGGVGDRAQR